MVEQPRTDEQIQRDVIEALIADQRVDSAAINVDVVGGAVYLTGVVPDVEQKQLARAIARRTKGVLDVVDEIGVLG